MPSSFADGRVTRLAETLRPVDAGDDVARFAATRLGLRIRETPLPTNVRALLVSGRSVVLNSRLDQRAQRLALSHEVGHALVAAGQCPWVTRDDEERFADAFARELLAPAELLQVSASVHHLADEWDVDPLVILAQLSRVGALPPLFRTPEGSVVCATCGTEERRPGCSCRVARRNPAQAPLLDQFLSAVGAGASSSSRAATRRASTAA